MVTFLVKIQGDLSFCNLWRININVLANEHVLLIN